MICFLFNLHTTNVCHVIKIPIFGSAFVLKVSHKTSDKRIHYFVAVDGIGIHNLRDWYKIVKSVFEFYSNFYRITHFQLVLDESLRWRNLEVMKARKRKAIFKFNLQKYQATPFLCLTKLVKISHILMPFSIW